MNDLVNFALQMLGGRDQNAQGHWNWQNNSFVGQPQPGPSTQQQGTGPLPDSVTPETLKAWYEQSPTGLHAWLKTREQTSGQADQIIQWLHNQTQTPR